MTGVCGNALELNSVLQQASQEKLAGRQFIQPYKSFLLAMDKVNSIEGNLLHAGKFQIPISKYLKEQVIEKILSNKLLKR